MRQLKVDLPELEMAFDNHSDLISYYLDLETGEVIVITGEERGLLESIYESYYDDQSETVDWVSAFEKEPLTDLEREQLLIADRVEVGLGDRFIPIPPEGSREGYQDMQAFIVTVHSQRLQERLERAISGRGAFRNFKDVLLDYPAERDRWFQFKRERLQQRILDWLEAHEITPLP